MKIFICGGSNSLREEGWSTYFAALMGDNVEIENISIGAAPSIMAAYRSILTIELSPGDVLIWEYALNDRNHIDRKGYDENLLLYFCEHIIRHCIHKKAYFLPLIFTPQNKEVEIIIDNYRIKLHLLFNNYLIDYLDVSVEFRLAKKTRYLSHDHFDNPNHYAKNGESVYFIARRTKDLIEQGLRLPHTIAPIYVKPDHRLILCTDFLNGQKKLFKNRIVSVDTWVPLNDPLCLPSFTGAGEIVALILITSPKGGAMTIKFKENLFTVSTTHKASSFPKPLLKIITFPQVVGNPIYYDSKSRLEISWAESASNAIADFGYELSPSAAALKAREAQIVGILAVEGVTKGSPIKTLLNTRGKKMKQTKELNVDGQVILNPVNIITRIKAENQKLLADMDENKARRLVRLALEELASEIAKVEEGVVKVPGFGRFRVQQLKREKDGEKTTVRRVLFKLISPKKGTANEDVSSE